MIIDKKESALAYRCPICGNSVISMVGIFSLSGDMVKLKCKCGGSETVLTYGSDRKLRLNVPCLVCEKPHNYTLNLNTFFREDNEVFRLPCSYTGIDLCFIGKEKAVRKALNDATEELMQMMEDAGLDDLEDLHNFENSSSPDYLVDEVISFILADMKEEGSIHCRCKDPERASYKFKVMDDGVRIYCESCGALEDFPIVGEASALDFLKTDEIFLE